MESAQSLLPLPAPVPRQRREAPRAPYATGQAARRASLRAARCAARRAARRAARHSVVSLGT